MENPLFSQASMSAAAAASSSRGLRTHRSTRRRTRSVSAARAAWVIGRAGRNAGGASVPASAAAGTKTPSVAEAEEPALEIAAAIGGNEHDRLQANGHPNLLAGNSPATIFRRRRYRSLRSGKTRGP